MQRRKDDKGRVLEKGESQRKDGIYMFRYNDLQGKRQSIYNSDLSKLRTEKKRILRDLEDGINVSGSNIVLNQQFDRYISMKTNLANSTKMNYLGLWECNVRDTVFGNKKICQIKKSDILAFYTSLIERGLKYSTLKTFNGMLAPCFELAVDDDVIRKNPCKGCLNQFFQNDARKREALTEEQEKTLLEFVYHSNVYSVYYPMLVFMLGSAVRCGEMIGLTWSDVDFKNNTLLISHQLLYKKKDGKYQFYADTPKTGAGVREIPLTGSVRKALLQQKEEQLRNGWRSERTIDGYADFCFTTKNKNPLMPSAVNNVLLNIVHAYNKQEMVQAKKEKREPVIMPDISAHILRHTGCTRMAESGMDLKVLQYIMGHSRIAVTMEVYNHTSTERNKKELEKFEENRLLG